jgi:hypothetical protein
MNRKLMIFALMALPLLSSAQQMTAVNEVIDCGQVLYKAPVTVAYDIRNVSNKPLTISKVLTSCGCTAVDYPRHAIASHGSAVVRVTYDAKQMGTFNKMVRLFGNGSCAPLVLTLKGKVVDEIVDFGGAYPFTLGQLQTDVNNIEFDDVNRGERPQAKIHVRNNTTQMAQPVLMHLPNYLSADVSPSRIAPGHAGVATITLNSKLIRDYGLTQTGIYLGFVPGDKVNPDNELTVSAVLLPEFYEQASAAHAPQPEMRLSATKLDLGTFGRKKKLKGQILIQNVGMSRLEIESVQMFTGGLRISLDKSKLKPGQTAKLKVTAVAEQLKKAKSKPRILMITNDPQLPKVTIYIHVN